MLIVQIASVFFLEGKGNGAGGGGGTGGGTSTRDSNSSLSKTDNCGGSGVGSLSTELESSHSLTDLSGYELMTFPSNTLSRHAPDHRKPAAGATPGSSSTQGSGALSGSSSAMLNYATLDLGSTDSMGDDCTGGGGRSPRGGNKSRHVSSATEESVSYTTIDFDKSDSLMRNAQGKDAKRNV